MKIIYLTLSNIETVNKKGIYTDLVREFIKNGDEVTIISPYERRENKRTHFLYEENVTILKVQIGNITKTKKIEKGISTLSIDYLYLNAIKKYLKNERFDLILYSTPPITFLKSIRYLKKINQCPTYLMLKDIFPQNAVDLKMLRKNSLIYRYFSSKEIKLYDVSDYIGCMSPKNVEYIYTNYQIDRNKLHILPNAISIDNDESNCIVDDNLLKKYSIPQDKYLFLYGGNLGKPQGVDFLIDNLQIIEKEVPHAFFLIVGYGTEYERLKKKLEETTVNNCQLINQLPKEEYDKLVSLCDIGLVLLDYRFTIPNFPSRILSYMEQAKPVLCITDKASDIGQIAVDNKFGLWSFSNDSKQLVESLRMMTALDLKEYGNNAFKYLKENYTVDKSYQIIKNNLQGK